MNKVALIDSDLILYRCGFACNEEPLEICLYTVKKSLENIVKIVDPDDYILYLSEGPTFRHMLPGLVYKGNRTAPKPKWYKEIKEYLADYWEAKVVTGIEADDQISIDAWKLRAKGNTHQYMVCTIDKDLNQIPGPHYNFVKDEFFNVCPGEADKMIFTQLLTGDTVDNIPGLPRVGPKTAEKILGEQIETSLEMLARCITEYKKHYPENVYENKLMETGNCVYILRKEGEMWEDFIQNQVLKPAPVKLHSLPNRGLKSSPDLKSISETS